MAKSKRYNPYEDAKNILRNKGNYHTAKQMGMDYEQYRQAAVPYYQNLISNGYEDLAQKFADSDYIKAQELFNGLKPDTTVDDYFSSVAANALDNASNPQRSQTANDLWDAYNNNNNLLNGELKYDANGNVVGGLNLDYYNTGKNQLSYLNNFDITAQPYYQGIMNAYQLKGNNAARSEQASGAANNAGNIDSYAQANANRQQLAFTTAGIESALAAANQNQANWQNVYNSMANRLTGMENSNANTLNAFQNIYATDSAERQNTLNTAASLAQQEMQDKINKYLADVGYDQAIYMADKELEGSKYASDANTRAAQIAADADRYAASQNYAGKVYASDVEKAIAEMNANGTAGENGGYYGLDGNITTAESLARQMYDAYKGGMLEGVTSKYDFENLLIQAGMDATTAEKWADYYLKRDKDMFSENPSSGNTSTGNTSTSSGGFVGGGLKSVLDNYKSYRP